MIDLFLNLMILQLLMGAFDTLYHHELKVALPRCPTARLELAIHAIRALLYSIVFLGLAWYEWHGFWTLLLIAIVLVEVGLTLWDFVIEDTTRLLPKSERITHTLLAINGGAAFVILATELPGWFRADTVFFPVDYGWKSWLLTLGGIGVGLSGLRDGIASWSVQRLLLNLDLDIGKHSRLLVSGGSGFIGSALIRELLLKGHEVTVMSRNPVATAVQFAGRVRVINNINELSSHERFEVVVNLAGAPVVGMPWTQKRRQVLRDSRLGTTRELLAYVKRMVYRPKVWIQASAIGFYGTSSNTDIDESSGMGKGFAAQLCNDWEQQTNELESLGVRRVILRFGLVFGRSGGAFPMMMLSYRFGAGAVLGDGKQYVSWIHIEDLLRVIALAIKDESIQGTLNAVAPDHPTYREFAHAVGHQLHRPVLLKIPATLMKKILGEMASLFVEGPKILPQRLQKFNFPYRFPDLRGALMDLL